MSLKFKDIPNEILWVLTLPKMVGSNTYDEAERIINKYPKYFPWEHKYKSIPKEVHKAYRREKYPNWDKPIVCIGGLLAQMKEATIKDYNGYSKKSVKEILEDFIKLEKDMVVKEKIRYDKDKTLWDKYYKKYNLEYRE